MEVIILTTTAIFDSVSLLLLLCSSYLYYITLKYIPLLLLFISYSGFCQDGYLPLNEQKQVYYSDVASPRKSKDEIYKSAQNWVTHTFGNYGNAVTSEDISSGKLMINSYIPVVTSLYDYIRFDLVIECKDNQYQVRIDKLDGISPIRTPVRISAKDNDVIVATELNIKTEINKKKRTEAEQLLKTEKADNENINNAIYKLMAGLKEFMAAGSTH